MTDREAMLEIQIMQLKAQLRGKDRSEALDIAIEKLRSVSNDDACAKSCADKIEDLTHKCEMANTNINVLVHNLVGYMQSYVSDSCCPHKFNLTGSDDIEKPISCADCDCESCKEQFWSELEENLLESYVIT